MAQLAHSVQSLGLANRSTKLTAEGTLVATDDRRQRPKEKNAILVMLGALLTTGLVLGAPAAATAPTITAKFASADAPKPLGIPGAWQLTLNAGPANLARWNAWAPDGSPINHYERDCYSPANIVPFSSYLTLTLTRQPSTCPYPSAPVSPPPIMYKRFTGALITSRGIFAQRTGVWEAKIYMPADSTGAISDWPAIWLDNEHAAGGNAEIDIAEALSGRACQLLHSADENYEHCMGITPGWHVFGVDITATGLTFWLDGRLVGQVSTTAYTMPLFAVVDMTVHLQPFIVPAALKIAWLRAWEPF
jgi:hypothetical protein